MSPGYIDLSKLRFYTVGTGDFVMDDDTEDFIDELELEMEDEEEFEEEGGGYRRRHLDQGGDYFMDGSAIDIAVFHLVSTFHILPGRSSLSPPPMSHHGENSATTNSNLQTNLLAP